MTRWTLIAAGAALFGAALWHLPATAQRAVPAQNLVPALTQPTQTAATRAVLDQPPPQRVAPQLITFDEYRDFRVNDIAQRRARLTRALAATDLSTAEKTSLEGRKAYYDRLAEMPVD